MFDHVLDNLSDEYFMDLLKFFPTAASQVGIHDFDEEMPEGTPEVLDRYRRRRQKFYDDVKAVDEAELSFNHRIDRQSLVSTIGLEIYEDAVFDTKRSHPQVGAEIGSAVYPLFMKEFAPFPERVRRIASRMEKIPRFIENSKRILSDPVDIWVKMGIEETGDMIHFFRLVQTAAGDEGIDQKLQARLDDAIENAIESLHGYEKWLTEETLPTARKNFAMNPEQFEKILEMRQLGMNSEELLDFGEEMLVLAKEKKSEVAALIAPGKSLDEVERIVRMGHLETFEEVLELTRETVEHSRRFVIESGYATLPEGEELKVVETPSFAKNLIPFGAYMPPGRFDKKQIGHYWMSRPHKHGDEKPVLQNQAVIYNTSIHEGYPGHHLQMVCANMNPSPSRLLVMGIEFVEGWAHYCEEKVSQMGFANEPETKFDRYNDMIWRAARIIVDVKLSRGEMSFDEAVDYLQKHTGLHRSSCITEVKRYTFTPGYQLSYLVGKKLINDLAASVEKEAGSRFSLKRFHDSMLYAGNLPLAYISKIVRHEMGLEKVGI